MNTTSYKVQQLINDGWLTLISNGFLSYAREYKKLKQTEEPEESFRILRVKQKVMGRGRSDLNFTP